MTWLLHILLSNAFGAAVLAAVVWPLCRICPRPAICRALWILVLLKLLAPPIVWLPIDRWIAHRPVQTARAASPALAAENLPDDSVGEFPAVLPSAPPKPGDVPVNWKARVFFVLPAIWAVGAIGSFILAALRVVALLRLLSHAPLAPPPIQQLARSVGDRLGLPKTPAVCFVPGIVCPALWALGPRPRVIIPRDLWGRLDEPKRRALLAHELAHLRRGDHRVRLLEFVAGVIYWWHPAVWLARRQIHDYEEQCCDAWVLWAMPASAHTYGSALLEAVDFVSATRPMRPALSTGLGEFRHLKRRLLMIKQGTVPRSLSRFGLAAVLGAAAVALPLAPTVGQVAQNGAPAAPGATGNVSGSESASPEIAEARERVEKLRHELDEAMSRLAVLEHGSPRAAGRRYGSATSGMTMGSHASSSAAPRTSALPAAAPPGIANTAGAGIGSVSAPAAGIVSSSEAAPGVSADSAPRQPGVGSVSVSGGGYGIAAGPRPGAMPSRAASGTAASAYKATDDNPQERLEGLERQLKQLMDEVRELRDQQKQMRSPSQDANRP